MKRTTSSAAIALLAVTFLGCGSKSPPTSMATPDDPPPPAPPSQEELVLQATIGPAGGALVGPPHTVFAGVRLVIAPGALAQETPISIVEATDPTQLPPRAAGVGRQFAISPASTALAMPATLTLPFTLSAVMHYARTSTEVKVWAKTDETTWTLREPTSTSSRTVTIDLPAFTIAAAGVRLPVAGPVCRSCIVLGLECLNGFCNEILAQARPPIVGAGAFSVDASALYYLTAVADHSVGPASALVRVDLSTGLVSVGPQTQGGTRFPPFPFAFGTTAAYNGSSWWPFDTSGFQGLNIVMRPIPRGHAGGVGYYLEGDRTTGLGAVFSSNGSLFRLVDFTYIPFISTPLGSHWASPIDQCLLNPACDADCAGRVVLGVAAPAPASPDSFWLGDCPSAIHRFNAAGVQDHILLPAGYTLSPFASVSAAPNGTVAIAAQPNGTVLLGTPGGTASPLNITNISQLVYDTAGGLWLRYFGDAQVLYIAPGTSTPITMSLAAPDSPTYDANITFSMRAATDGSVIVLTRDAYFHRLRRR